MQRQQPRRDVVVVVSEETQELLRWPVRIGCAAVSLVLLCFLIVLFSATKTQAAAESADCLAGVEGKWAIEWWNG